MSSVCISRCLSDATEPLVPVRATYVNLYKWPESDAEFLRSRSSGATAHGRPSRVVDRFSCRQMYLRSYRFSRKESVREKTVKCFGRVKEKLGGDGKRRKSLRIRRRRRRTCLVWRKIRIVLLRFFNRLLSCSATVDVADQRNAFFWSIGFCFLSQQACFGWVQFIHFFFVLSRVFFICIYSICGTVKKSLLFLLSETWKVPALIQLISRPGK